MSKVGILSMQRIKNYGSFMQAYGLKSLLEDLGHEVSMVDYRVERPLIVEKSESKLGELIKERGKLIHKLQFINHKLKYAKYLNRYLEIYNEKNYTPFLDTLIIGSDEVFNCIQSNKNVGYSLELFGKNHRANKLISYAASFGNTTLEKLVVYDKYKEIGEYLCRFDAISVRDENSRIICSQLSDEEINMNIDPVLAYDFTNEIKNLPSINVNEKYLVVYAYSNRMTNVEMLKIKKLADSRSLKIYTIGGVQEYADRFIDCSPFAVLSYFLNAEFIVTDTFHGSIFSIITMKNFVTIIRKSSGQHYGNEEKLSDLLLKFDLGDRILKDLSLIENLVDIKIDYTNVNEKLDIYRKETVKYLQENV